MSTSNRRRFQRVEFDAAVSLGQGHRHWQCDLLDISLKGALLRLPEHSPTAPDPQAPLVLTLTLDGNCRIVMHGEAAHLQGRHLGLRCSQIDVDSMAHLRQLISLNTGDASAAERELRQLAMPD